MRMRTLLILILLLLTGLVQAQAPEEEPEDETNPWSGTPPTELRAMLAEIPEIMDRTWYQVEVLVFAREEATNEEHWRLGRYPSYPGSNLRLGTATDEADDDEAGPLLPEDAGSLHEQAVEAGAWRTLPNDTLKLTDAARSMTRGRYRILYHQTWRQPVLEREQALPIYIEGGQSMPLTLEPETLERLPGESGEPEDGEQREPAQPDRGIDGEASPRAEVPRTQGLSPAQEILQVLLPAEPELRGTLTLSRARFLHLEPSLWLTKETDEGQRYHVDINQHRRMRSERLHYLDHPLFGVLIRLDPRDHPEQEEKEQMEEALDEHTRRE